MSEVPKLTLNKILNHWKTVRTHRKWVRRYCALAGIPWRGWKHDLSKYSPTEFFESARYWTGTGSPINECKKYNGWSKAWLHHKGRNSHHYEYWMDNFDKGGEALLMPLDDFTEQVCDFIAAGITYNGGIENFNFIKEYDWWKNKRIKCAMHPKNKEMLEIIFNKFRNYDSLLNNGISNTPLVEKLIKDRYIQKVWKQVVSKK